MLAVVSALFSMVAGRAGPLELAPVSASTPLTLRVHTASDPADVLGVLSGLLQPPTPKSPAPPVPFAAPIEPDQPVEPDAAISVNAAAVRASTVKVTGVACGFRVEGSGFSPEADTVLTNAHVVAGVAAPEVLVPDGRRLPAQVVMFDPVRDVAVMHVPGLAETPLPLGPAVPGASGLVYGHPRGQDDLEVSAVRVLGRETADVPDIYNRALARRNIVALAGEIQSGDSGAAVVSEEGEVMAMVFAVDVTRPVGYAIPSEDLRQPLAAPRTANGDSGPCLASGA
ncbi:MAG: trypsin-like peptidase domain-containing protein [Acidimicrobiia bacterium]